jgi:hypothetical protein
MDSALTIPGLEMYLLLLQRYPNAFIPTTADAVYHVATEAAFDKFRDELSTYLFNMFGNKWYTFQDCDDFSIHALSLAYQKQFRARFDGKGSADGIAFGMIRGLMDPNDPKTMHQFNFRVDGNKKIREFEPQTCKDMVLTQAQCEKVNLLYI